MERERKFLLKKTPPQLWRYPHHKIAQGYLADESHVAEASQVRLRRIDTRWVITVKKGSGRSRQETEVALPRHVATKLWPMTVGRRVEKTRYEIPYQGLKIELDVYRGHARGLIVAEVEFRSDAEMKAFVTPPWFGRDVSDESKYSNANIAENGWKRGGNS